MTSGIVPARSLFSTHLLLLRVGALGAHLEVVVFWAEAVLRRLYVFSLVFVDHQYTSLISGCCMVSIVSSHGVLAVSLFTSYKRFRADTVSVL